MATGPVPGSAIHHTYKRCLTMQCCTILQAFKKGCLLKMGCYSENNSDNFKDLCWPNYLSVTVLLIKLQLQNADSLFKCPFKFSKDRYSLFQCEGTRGVHQYTPSSNIVQHREHVWCPPWCGPRGGTVEEYFHFLTLPGLGPRYPRTTADTSHLTCAGLGRQ